jgi:hypothetical protein
VLLFSRRASDEEEEELDEEKLSKINARCAAVLALGKQAETRDEHMSPSLHRLFLLRAPLSLVRDHDFYVVFQKVL